MITKITKGLLQLENQPESVLTRNLYDRRLHLVPSRRSKSGSYSKRRFLGHLARDGFRQLSNDELFVPKQPGGHLNFRSRLIKESRGQTVEDGAHARLIKRDGDLGLGRP